jgi:hypothetical protein
LFFVLKSYQDQSELVTTEKDRIRVVVRVRPITSFELQGGEREIVQCDQQALIVRNLDKLFSVTILLFFRLKVKHIIESFYSTHFLIQLRHKKMFLSSLV